MQTKKKKAKKQNKETMCVNKQSKETRRERKSSAIFEF